MTDAEAETTFRHIRWPAGKADFPLTLFTKIAIAPRYVCSQARQIVALGLAGKPSVDFCGYWQRNAK
jgi:hypothetical protein